MEPREGVAPPAPSLLGGVIGHIRAMEEHLTSSIATLTDLAAWDASSASHTGLQQAVDELRRMHDDWQRGMLTHVQSLWFGESATYNEYRQKIDRTLTIRHRAELHHAFPRLVLDASAKSRRSQESEADTLARVGGNMELARAANHVTGLGYDLEPANARLLLLIQRQLHERHVFDRTVLEHSERLADAKRTDLGKLRGLLARTEQTVDAMLAVVDKKIAASHQVAATDRLYGPTVAGTLAPAPASSRQPAGAASGSRPATGSSAMRPVARASSGSALDASLGAR